MSDEDIINYYKKGYSVEKITYKFPTIRFKKRKKPSWQMINRVERVIIKYLNDLNKEG